MLTRIFLALAVVAAAASAPLSLPRGVQDPVVCYDYVLISSRGTGEPHGPSMAFKGMINTTLKTLPYGIEIPNPYPADWSAGSAGAGAAWIHNFLIKSVQACPDQKVALLGWSQGAAVATQAVMLGSSGSGSGSGSGSSQKVDSRQLENAVKAMVLVGNPLHRPGRPGNVDENGGNSTAATLGRMLTLGSPTGAADNVMDRYALEGNVLDVCYRGDFACGSDVPKDPNAHGRYGGSKSVQAMGARFLIDRLRAHKHVEMAL